MASILMPTYVDNIRLATLNDLSRIATVAAAGFFWSPVFQFQRPYYAEFPEDTLFSYRTSTPIKPRYSANVQHLYFICIVSFGFIKLLGRTSVPYGLLKPTRPSADFCSCFKGWNMKLQSRILRASFSLPKISGTRQRVSTLTRPYGGVLGIRPIQDLETQLSLASVV